MIFKTVVAGKTPVHTQVVHLLGQDSFEIFLDNWSCAVRFKSDEGISRYMGQVEDGKLYIDIYNHNNPLGEFLFTPFTIASISGRSVYMTYATNLVDSATLMRRFEYVLWMDA